MDRSNNFGSFFRENKELIQEFLETRAEIYRLRFIRLFSQLAGRFIWLIVSMILLALLVIFLGLVTGFWLSELTGSYTKGFGLTVLMIVAVLFLIAVMRNILFVNPIMRFILNITTKKPGKENNDGTTA